MKTLLLIDANSIIHRCFHALPPMTAESGAPTNALYGLSSVLLKLWREGKPDYIAAAFDRPEPTFRKEQYREYKAQRPKAPRELIDQIIGAHELFRHFGIQAFEQPGFEADDIIATLAAAFRSAPDLRVVILTGDMDTLQLVEGDKVVVRTFKKGISDTVTYDEQAVRERYGLAPSQLIDYKALVGDPSDNVKGVPGIGPKTAGGILQTYGTIARFLEHPPKDEKLADKLRLEKETLELSRTLVALRHDVPIAVPALERLSAPDGIPQSATEYFREMGFESLVRRVSTAPGAAGKGEEKPPNRASPPTLF
jgi:DNA polymerase-1